MIVINHVPNDKAKKIEDSYKKLGGKDIKEEPDGTVTIRFTMPDGL